MNLFLIGEYLVMLQARTWSSRALSPSFSSVLARLQSARDNHVLACNFVKYLLILKICFTHRLKFTKKSSGEKILKLVKI